MYKDMFKKISLTEGATFSVEPFKEALLLVLTLASGERKTVLDSWNSPLDKESKVDQAILNLTLMGEEAGKDGLVDIGVVLGFMDR